ncbi:hypothetical protein D3C81_952330 [compost metagenome]
MLIDRPLGIEIHLTPIHIAQAAVDSVEMKPHHPKVQRRRRADHQADLLHPRIAVERPGVVACHFTLEPRTQATAEAIEQRVVLL